MKIASLVTAALAVACLAGSVRATPQQTPLVVYYAGGNYTPQQIAAMSPEDIHIVASNVRDQVLVIMGSRGIGRDGRATAASPAHQAAAVDYVRANRSAFLASKHAVVDAPVPSVTPDNINDPALLQEIARTAAYNALCARKRSALDAAMTAIIRPVGPCNIVDCSDR